MKRKVIRKAIKEVWRDQRRRKLEGRERKLSTVEVDQMVEWLKIYYKNGASEHWHVNKIITEKGKWWAFDVIRAKNKHHMRKPRVLGISPLYYSVTIEVIGRDGGAGARLIDSRRY